jgi:imidazolonepropionase-like amidohydrolase
MFIQAGKRGYRANTAFDGEKAIAGGALVLVDGGVITGVEPGAAPAPDGYDVTDLPGATVLPGLIDAHSHLCGNNEFDALDRLSSLSDDELDAAIQAALATQLASGVTSVRDLGDSRWAVVDRHRQRAEGPSVVASGPPITSVGGHCAATSARSYPAAGWSTWRGTEVELGYGVNGTDAVGTLYPRIRRYGAWPPRSDVW